MDFFEVAATMPTVRRFLDRPVEDSLIEQVLATANMAPSGSNAQPWEFVVARSAETRGALQRLYQEVWEPYKETAIIRGRKELSARAVKAIRIGDEFAASLAIVPVHILVFLDRPKMRVKRGGAEDIRNFGATYGSVFPAIELLMLSARALGLGTAVTTMLSNREPETKRLLGVPGQYQLITLVPMGYPAEGFKRPYRKPVWPKIHAELWDRPWPRSGSKA